MAVQFILGRSGTGKTHYCIETIVEALLGPESRPLLFLVPEQATYQAQRAILNNPRITGYNRLHVLSFDRLSFLLLGKNVARPAISRLGRTMVIQRILRDCSDKLSIFGGSARHPGLGKRLADTITQLQQYANSPDDVKDLVGKLQIQSAYPLTMAKFADIGIVFEEYLKFIEGRFLDPDIQLTTACKAVAKAGFLKGAKLWVDGFAGFTAGELALLTELLKAVEDAQIALCLDPTTADLANPDKTQIDPADLFGPTVQTYAELVERIKKCKLKIADPLIFNKPHRFSGSSPLGHIERNFYKKVPDTFFRVNGKIRIVSAPNARAEVKFVAQQIAKLVRDAGFRYRDIAVIASDIDSYENYIKASFEDYNIPVFIDKRRPLNQHPVIELISSALAAVTNDFPAGQIFAYLKTDILDIERSDINLLENYCIALGITASDWAADKPWRYAGDKAEQFDEHHVDRIRKKAIEPLLQLRKQLVGDDGKSKMLPPEEFRRIILDFLETANVRNRLALWVEDSLRKGDFAAADEHPQLFYCLVGVFDELVEAFSGTILSCEDYLAIMRSAFSQMTLAFIPPNLDQVLIGSIERSRHPDLKAVFLIGTTERQFPTPIVFDSILSENDRLAAASGLDLPPGLRQEMANRPYLAYIAFTRPSQLLCITYPAIDQKSNAVVRSPFVDDLCLLFDDLEAESIVSTLPAIEDVSNRYELEDTLCSGSTEIHGILQEMLADDQLGDIGSRVAFAINYENKADLSDSAIQQLFGREITSSASRLSTFAACPYKHFARYVLELKKRDEFKLEPLDLGNFYHRVLDALLKRAVADKVDFGTIESNALIKILNEEIEKLCGEASFISKFKAHSPHNTFIVLSATEYLQDCAVAVSQMVRAGLFRPVMSEISFGLPKSPGPSIGELKITLGDGRSVSLNGRIDRLDIAEISGRKTALVFDYKKRSEDFNWAEFFYGLDIQLAIYMLAVRNTARNVADDIAGAFYLPVEMGPESIDIGKAADSNPKFAHKAKGIFNGEYFKELDSATSPGWNVFYNFFISTKGDQYGHYGKGSALRPADFEAFLKFCSRKIIDLAEQIASGKITAEPYRLGGVSPCSRCDYKPVCRFDWQINDYNLLASVNKQQALEQITNTNGSKKD